MTVVFCDPAEKKMYENIESTGICPCVRKTVNPAYGRNPRPGFLYVELVRCKNEHRTIHRKVYKSAPCIRLINFSLMLYLFSRINSRKPS